MGITAISKVPIIIIRMVSSSAAFRPVRSAYVPRTSAPNGLTRYETPNVPKASIRDTVGSLEGKNALEIEAAKNPYEVRSYHSSVFPAVAASTAFRARRLLTGFSAFI